MYWVVMPVSLWGKYDRGLGLSSLRLLLRHMDVWKGSRGAYIWKLTKGMSSFDAITCVHLPACDGKAPTKSMHFTSSSMPLKLATFEELNDALSGTFPRDIRLGSQELNARASRCMSARRWHNQKKELN